MKKILFIAFMFLAVASNSQVIFGYYDNLIRAKDSLIVDVDFMKSADTTVYLTDVTYHEFSSDSVTWSKNPSATDKWMRVSSDAKFTWKVLDLEGLERYWLNDGVYIYNNEDYGTKVHINTALVDSFDLNVGGDINTYGYIFIDKDSLSHTNIYNGGAVAGMYLVASGDTAVWQDLPSGFGETNLARNVNSRGVGVFEQKTDTILDFRGIASLTDLLTVNLASGDSTIDLDLALKTITAGTGLTGGGSMENDINLAVSIPSLPAFVSTVDNAADWFAFYDASAGIHYKLHVEDFLSDVDPSVDLFINNALQETSIDTLNLVAGKNIVLSYASPGRVHIASALDRFIHEPDAYIAFSGYLYSYDISEGTALSLSNAPTADWAANKSYSEENYIWTASGTSVYRYDIENDTTIVLPAADNEIQWLIGASDGIYAISRGEAYYINKTSASPTPVFYGSTVTNYDITAATSVVDGDEYLVLYSDVNDRIYYKKIRSDHSGFDNDAWTATTCSLGEDAHHGFGVADPYWWVYDENNVTKVFESTSYLTAGSGDCLNYRSDFKTYLVPSGREFLEGNTDAIITLESTPVTPLSATPTSYNIVSTIAGEDYGTVKARLDMGIYVSRNNTIEYSDDYAYEQAISDFVYDIHAQPVTISVFNTGVNVIVGGLGYVYFHAYDEDPKQFMQRQVYVVNNALTRATKVESAITFVYYDSDYTSSGDPKQPYIPKGFDLLIDSVRVDQDIDTLNMVAGDGISLTYLGGNGGVEIGVDSTRYWSKTEITEADTTRWGDSGTDDQTAAEVSYTNTTSNLTATDVQAAIDEIDATVDNIILTGGDNWGNDVVNSDITLTGDGTSGNVLKVDTTLIPTYTQMRGEISDSIAGLSSGGDGITALTGEVTASGTGSVAATVADNVIDYGNVDETLKSSTTNNTLTWDFSANGIIFCTPSSGTVSFSNYQVNKSITVVLTLSGATISWPASAKILDGSATLEDGTFYVYIHCISSSIFTVSITKEAS
jgi:hypothetical protein